MNKIDHILDVADYIISPKRWPRWARRLFIVTFPISFPAFGIITPLVIIGVLCMGIIHVVTYAIFYTLRECTQWVSRLWSAP